MRKMLILDLGGQYCHLIKRTLADDGIEADIVGPEFPKALDDDAELYGGIILSGGPASVYSEGAPNVPTWLLNWGVPMLGICYGHQLLAHELGGRVEPSQPEYGDTSMVVLDRSSILAGISSAEKVWMSHGDSVVEMPPKIKVLAMTRDTPIAAFADEDLMVYGVQFHPEVVHTPCGRTILQNFVELCGVKPVIKADQVASLIEQTRDFVGQRKVFFFVSGGVDSTVAFSICAKALRPEQLVGLYFDTGFMRKNETEELTQMFYELGFADQLRICDESKLFLSVLEGISDPEGKREIIGRLFVEAQSRAMKEGGISANWMIGQGTIYPDVIESGDGSAATIKTHHNQCAEVKELIQRGLVIEPLREFYKDQVREIGTQLGLDPRFLNRWPFPGPGLAIRCLCSTISGSIKGYPVIDPDLGDCYRVPLRSVGVQGDARTYRTTLAVREHNTDDRSRKLTQLGRFYPDDRIILLLDGVEDLIEGQVRPARLSADRLARLREADYVVRTEMARFGMTDHVWQFPVVLLPLWFGDGESIVLRPVQSRDGMTANFVLLPDDVLKQICKEILRIDGVAAVFLDASNKPPATIEWE